MAMLSAGSQFWSDAEKSDYLLRKSKAIAWIEKGRWAVREAACLVLGIDPDSMAAKRLWETSSSPFFDDYDAVVRIFLDAAHVCTIEGVRAVTLSLMGEVRRYVPPISETKESGIPFTVFEEMTFPAAVFFRIAEEKIFPNTERGINLPCFGIFHSAQQEALGMVKGDFRDVVEDLDADLLEALFPVLRLATEMKKKEQVVQARRAENPPEADCPPWGCGFDPDDFPPPFDDDPCDEFVSLDAPPAIETPESVKATPDADLSAAIDFGAATRDVLDVLADYLKRPPERRKSPNPDYPTEAQCVLDALDAKARRNGWGKGVGGRLSQAQWVGVRLLFLPTTENKGCKGSRWGDNTNRDTKK